MEVNEQIDARDMRDGDWSWYQHELLHVFRPLIGPNAAWLYIVMCRLIPYRELQLKKGIQMDITIASARDASGLTQGTTHRCMESLVKIGMLERVNGANYRAPVYNLVSLKKLAELGTSELKQRLGVPGWNAESADDAATAHSGTISPAPQGRSTSEGSALAAEKRPEELAGPPTSPEESGVPGWNADVTSVVGVIMRHESHENYAETSPIAELAFQNRGVGVPEQGGRRSKIRGSAFHTNDAFNTEEEDQSQKNNIPLPPSRGSAADGPILPFVDCHFGDAGFTVSVGLAARWVARDVGISGSRIIPVIVRALTLRAEKSGESLEAAAKLAVKNAAQFLADADLLRIRWSWPNFFEHGHWLRPKTWPYDQAKLDSARASIGRFDPVGHAQALWVKVQHELVECFKVLEPKAGKQAQDLYEIGLALTTVQSIVEKAIPAWVLASNDPPRSRRVLEMLRQYVNPIVQRVAGEIVEIRVVAH